MESYDFSVAELTDEEKSIAAQKGIEIARMQKSAAYKRYIYGKRVYEAGNQKENIKFSKDDYYQIICSYCSQANIKYVVDNDNRKVLQELCSYFSQDDSFDGDLNKGIILHGNVGCGKTLIMSALYINQVASYRVIRCDSVAQEYRNTGSLELFNRPLNDYMSTAYCYFGQTVTGWCFDDLGTEEIANNFGNKLNVMEKIIECWNENRSWWNKIHITTNLTVSQIEEIYGDRVRSRMREMFNVIEFPTYAKDRR